MFRFSFGCGYAALCMEISRDSTIVFQQGKLEDLAERHGPFLRNSSGSRTGREPATRPGRLLGDHL